LAVTRGEKTNQKRVSVYFREAKYVFIESVFGSKDWVKRRKTWESALLIEKPFTHYMRVCGKLFKKEDYICK
jgi:hypothetical protein